ncbi:TolB protein [Tepidimonas ignava]|uniref:Tol-Pal system protein TolB n=1 Tax=Tepidimonas ignava TaxID=114249 RepID=A0A4R3LHL9_9BURK|nr:Tol-Pal system beta propeller repeat protein TolB [Tepidimonas ignava]TCS98988.1 TolB protein [Tepidimonas ignava]TSE22929.1 Dipeptidyl-peptidase 5 [Tepidimonas ignava]
MTTTSSIDPFPDNPWALHRRQWLGAAAAALAAPWARAQFRVEVTGVGMQQIPFAVAPWRVPGGLPQDVPAIVAADLVRSGLLRQVPSQTQGLDETTRPDLAPWKAQGVDALITGSVRPLADGRFDVRFRLWDAVRGTDLGGQSYPVGAGQLRLAAHRIADYVYEKLTGERGVFATRIAYVGEQGGQHRLWVADADGENAQPALTSREPIISPAWSPNGAQLAYVSFEARKPVIYVHDIATGRRRLLASFRGSNSAPAWSPDGRRVYATLTLAGSSQIYALDLDGGQPQRITQTGGIDTEPAFAPDGKSVYFVSDRGGSPQIYRMTPDGREVTRVTYDGGYNISPAISPDGRHMVYVTRQGGAFQLRLMDLSSGAVTALTDTQADESPGFAPNGRLIIYATRTQGREALMTTSLDGRVKARLNARGNVREPDWGPWMA